MDDVSVFISMRFRLSTLMLICMRFHLCPLSRALSNRCVFDENAQRFSVDRRSKRIEMYAFSNENALVWTGSNTGKHFRRNQNFWKGAKFSCIWNPRIQPGLINTAIFDSMVLSRITGVYTFPGMFHFYYHHDF